MGSAMVARLGRRRRRRHAGRRGRILNTVRTASEVPGTVPIRRPVGRPADIVALELLVSILAALEVGLLLQLGLAGWGAPGIGAGQVPGVLAALGLVVLIGWAAWLIDRGGWLLAGANVPVALIAGLLLVAGPAMGPAVVDAPAFLLLLVGSIAGIACGLALPAPSAPRRATDPTGRTAPGTNLTPYGAAIAGRLHRGRAATAGAARAAGSRIPSARRAPDDGALADETLPADLRAPQPTGRGAAAGSRSPAAPARPSPQPARPAGTGSTTATGTPARPGSGTPAGASPTRSRFIGDPRSSSSFDLPVDAPAPRPRPESARPFITLPDTPDEDPEADPFPVWPPSPVPAPPPAAPRWGVPVSPVDDGDVDDDADARA